MRKALFFVIALLTMSAWAQTPATLTEANALEDNTEFTFNGDAVVTLKSGNYMFLRDDSGYGMIQGTFDGTFENGDVLAQGWNATKTSANGWAWYIDAAGLSASGETNATLAAAIVTTSFDESLLNAYICYHNVTFSMFGRKIILPDNTSIPTFDLFGIDMPGGFNDTRHWDVYGVIAMQGTALKFCPAEWVLYVEPEFLRGDVNDDGKVDISDMSDLIDYLLSNKTTEVNVDAADCDTNGEVGISDVSTLIDYLLKGTW